MEGGRIKTLEIIIITVLFIIFLSSGLLAQAPDTLWTKLYGGTENDAGESVQQTSDGGYIIAGSIAGDVWLIKTDSLGDTMWTKTYGDSSGDAAYDVCETIDGYVLTGFTNPPSSGGFYVYVIKTGINGDSIWAKRYFGGMGMSIAQTPDSGFVVVGHKSFATHLDVWLLKLDQTGDTTWTKTFGGTENDIAKAVQVTTDGGYIISGYSASSGTGGADAYLIKTNSSGDSLWATTYGYSRADCANSVQQTLDGGYIFAGYTIDSISDTYDLYIVKTDSLGAPLWEKIFGPDSADIGMSISQISDSGYIVVGSTRSFGQGNWDIWLLRTDINGDTIWTTTYGGTGHDSGHSVQQTSDNGYILVGRTDSFGAGSGDVWMIKVGPEIGIKEEIIAESPSPSGEIELCPNPFTNALQIKGCSQVKVYDISGRFVAMVNRVWDGRNAKGKEVKAGIYFLKADGKNVGKAAKVR